MQSNAFNEGIAKLKAIFGNGPFETNRALLIWRACEELTDSEFDKIIYHFMSSYKSAPLPKDFFEAAKAELHRRPRSTNEEPYVIQCEDCQDTGFKWINADDGHATWCFCHCGEGLLQMDRRKLSLPRWDYSMKMTCKSRPFPVSAFKPKTVFNPDQPVESLMERVTAWNNEIKKACEYWLSRLSTNQGA